MKEISLKGIVAGIFAVLVLSFPMEYLFTEYLLTIYDDVAPAQKLSEAGATQHFVNNVVLRPLSIFYGVISILILVGIPGYIAAFIANKAFILNSFAIASIFIVIGLTGYKLIFDYPLLFLSYFVLTCGVAYLAGYIRQIQVAKLVDET